MPPLPRACDAHPLSNGNVRPHRGLLESSRLTGPSHRSRRVTIYPTAKTKGFFSAAKDGSVRSAISVGRGDVVEIVGDQDFGHVAVADDNDQVETTCNCGKDGRTSGTIPL